MHLISTINKFLLASSSLVPTFLNEQLGIIDVSLILKLLSEHLSNIFNKKHLPLIQLGILLHLPFDLQFETEFSN
jgi:hypothetical protein